MQTNWYYTTDGKNKIGPLTFAALQELAASGTLQPTHMVRQDGEGRWTQAKTVQGLFPVTPAKSETRPTAKPKSLFGNISDFANKAQAKLQEKLDEAQDAVKNKGLQRAVSDAISTPRKPDQKTDQPKAPEPAKSVVSEITQKPPEKPATLPAPIPPTPKAPEPPKWDENDPTTWRAIQGHAGTLDVYEDKVVITPKGVMGFMTRGLSGTCEVPYRTVTAIQFREGGPVLTGYITFDCPGVTGGMLRGDRRKSNTFIFRQERNSLMKRVKEYVEGRMAQINRPAAAPPAPAPSANSRADELMKLAALLKDGVISQEEFTQMKADLLNRPAK